MTIKAPITPPTDGSPDEERKKRLEQFRLFAERKAIQRRQREAEEAEEAAEAEAKAEAAAKAAAVANYHRHLAELPAFSIGVIIFFANGTSILHYTSTPKWMRDVEKTNLPEFPLIAGESIEESVAIKIREIFEFENPDVRILETRPRGDGANGVVTVCYTSVPNNRYPTGAYASTFGEQSIYSRQRLSFGYGHSIDSALFFLANNPQQVASLVGTPYFTINELCRGLNYVRDVAGIKARVDIRNLRRQVEGANWLRDSGRLGSGAHRPAKLYLP